MLRTTLVHPTILRALASSGHGSLILIADGNYPVATASPPTAERVYLNLRPGMPTVTAVLDTLLSSINVEAAHVMQPADGSTPPIFADFSRLLPALALQRLERDAFYDLARHPNLSLAIATG